MIELGFPCDEKTAQFYSDVVSLLDRRDIQDLYHAALFSTGQRDARLGIFELAVDYKAKISVVSVLISNASSAIAYVAKTIFFVSVSLSKACFIPPT